MSEEQCVAVVGCGYWGKHLVRNFHDLGSLRVVCDVDPSRVSPLRERFGVSHSYLFGEVLQMTDIRGVVIATPAAMHYTMAKQALEANKDVFVEKPLALNVQEAEELNQLAQKNKCVLMVGHLLRYHPAIRRLKEIIQGGTLGRVQYIHSSRLNFGKLRTEENILWSFAPHDVSVILYLLDEDPISLAAHGGGYLNPTVTDVTLTSCHFASGVTAHIFVSWLHPFKEQKLVVVGDRQMAVFDDTSPDRKLVLYQHQIDWIDRHPIARRSEGQVVPLTYEEPLRVECAHFLECISRRIQPHTDGNNGIRVLRILNASERSLKLEGQLQELSAVGVSYFADPTAKIDAPCKIGEGTRIWHYSHIMAHSSIGAKCNLGQNVHIGPQVRVGNNVKIQNNVSIYTGVELEDDVFCGPSMVFTNVTNPRSHINRKDKFRKTLVRRGATLGANSTIVCGVTIGRYALIGAGAVVTRDVCDYALVVGAPARQIGWVCQCGERLSVRDGRAKCESCGYAYLLDVDRLSPIPTSAWAPPNGDAVVLQRP